ncbi:deaminase [Enterococcus canis]|uniref:Deaminase n=1 Tax=Enterococcus canis TaxID=214095 RepID=A0A1L8RCW3_9ENTE|nr:amidohydrolase family protein [Enterococcus canis]OJG17564.1 deaminase [Enterococcus canis]
MNYWLTNVKMETGYLYQDDWAYGTQTALVALRIEAGLFKEIIPMNEWQADELPVVDGHGALLLPGIVEKHCHLDKSKLGSPWQPVAPASSIVERFEQEIPALDALPLSIEERAQNLIDAELTHGVTRFRSHIDIEPATELRYLKAIQQLVADAPYDVEFVAFPQHGFLRSNSESLVEAALKAGAQLIGGVDPYTLDGDYQTTLKKTFDLAKKYQAGIDIHLHNRETAGRETIKEIIRLTEEYGWQGQVAISHAFGLNDFTGAERKQVFQALAENNIHIISSIPLSLGTIPPLRELQAYGVQVHIGCDNVYDSWSTLGDGSLQQKLVRYLEIFSVSTQEELTQSLGLITDHITTLDQNGQRSWPNLNDEATFILTAADCSAEFVSRETPVETSYLRGNQVYQR